MRTHTIAGLSLTALVMAGFVTSIETRAGGGDADAAAEHSNKAVKALSKGRADKAVAFAEAAAALAPRDPAHRVVLGQSYLKAGRFTSALQAFTDALSLDPANGRTALNLALAQIAEGQWDTARQTLAAHEAHIPARDRGLAIALAGDPVAAVEVLTLAARAPEADARTRQNLALALALSGRWKEAKAIVEVDVSPAEASKRIMAWMSFARPTSASDQVAALLGVVAVKDEGQPVGLALVAPAAAVPTEVASVDAYMPGRADARVEAAALGAPVATPVAAVEPADPVSPQMVGGVRFGERREVVQAVQEVPAARSAPVRTIAAKGAFKRAVAAVAVAPRSVGKGDWYVQLGAYESVGVAKDGWARAKRRYAAFARHTPFGMAYRAPQGQFYRLSVGGFARADATAMCRAFRARGGACFVRAGAGDQMARWIKPGRVQLASR